MSEEDSTSGSDTALSSSPPTRSVGIGSDLFKAVLNDCFLDETTRFSKSEYDRYQARKERKKDDAAHVTSTKCEACRAVLAMCRCDVLDGIEMKLGQKVHWADEVWKRPLITICDDDDPPRISATSDKAPIRTPKPILKHKATCIIIISE